MFGPAYFGRPYFARAYFGLGEWAQALLNAVLVADRLVATTTAARLSAQYGGARLTAVHVT